jgi:hypothetical protein
MLDGIVRYFDLRAEPRAPKPAREAAPAGAKRAAAPSAAPASVFPQYGAVALGVLADPLLRNYTAHHTFDMNLTDVAGRTGFALLMAIALLPAVYKNAFDPDKPILVQLCALFASGLGWQSLFQAGATAAGAGA